MTATLDPDRVLSYGPAPIQEPVTAVPMRFVRPGDATDPAWQLPAATCGNCRHFVPFRGVAASGQRAGWCTNAANIAARDELLIQHEGDAACRHHEAPVPQPVSAPRRRRSKRDRMRACFSRYCRAVRGGSR